MNITLLIVAAVLVVWALSTGDKLPHPFRSRSCQGKGWRRAFPAAPKAQIREFLALFVEAFAFSNNEKLKLRPEDLVLDIYRALYPHRWQADALEVETLADILQEKYNVNLSALWHEGITLGELFSACTQSASVAKSPNNSLQGRRP